MSSEQKIIEAWLTEIFKRLESDDSDVRIKKFTFGPLKQTLSGAKYPEKEQKCKVMLRDVRANVETNGVEKSYNLVIKVLPTCDFDRFSKRQTFFEMLKILKFSKEVQVYLEIVDPVNKSSGQSLSELFPFAVEGETFRQRFKEAIHPVKEELFNYLSWSNLGDESISNFLDLRIHKLFWKLVKIKAKPTNITQEVLTHGNLNLSNILFKYDRTGRPVSCKFLGLSNMSVSSNIMDIIIFMFSSISSDIIEQSYLSLLLTYHSHFSQVKKVRRIKISFHLHKKQNKMQK